MTFFVIAHFPFIRPSLEQLQIIPRVAYIVDRIKECTKPQIVVDVLDQPVIVPDSSEIIVNDEKNDPRVHKQRPG